MKKVLYFILFTSIVTLSSCDEWLQRSPRNIVTGEQIYKSAGTINSVIAGLYDRLPDWGGIHQDPAYYTHFDEGMLGQNVNNIISIGFDYARYYDYILIRDINFHLRSLKNTDILKDEERRYYIAEARFLRAYTYFELIKRLGGVPLIDNVMIFESDIDIERYQIPRSKESDMYDFIANEIDEIKDDLSLTPTVQYNRASIGAALALKSRAMLYAGSLAKYNSQMSDPVSLTGKEVGIALELASDYFEKALDAAEELIALNYYELYDKNTNKSENFYEALTKPGAQNKEIIFVKEFDATTKPHNWTYNNLPRTQRNMGFGGDGGTFINPSLNLVDAFDMKDGSSGKLIPYTDPNHRNESGNDAEIDGDPDAYIYYDAREDIFADKDPRLAGTIFTPGSSYNNFKLDLKAGVANFDGSKLVFRTGSLNDYPKNNKWIIGTDTLDLAGQDGPTNSVYCTRTGFYVKKSLDNSPSADLKKSGIQFVRYRYAEVLLNAAEAAFELGETGKAKDYIKQVRDRAGVETSPTMTLEQIRNERRVELAFEGQRYFDVKRWRIAEDLFDGNINTPTAMIYGLWPYKVHRPGHETDGKWIYVRRIPAEFKYPRKFVRANYYSSFSTDVLSKNPKLVKNPGH